MTGTSDEKSILERISQLAARGKYRLTDHALEEMLEDSVSSLDLLHSISQSTLLENYPDHKRGPCCLIFGRTALGRSVHIVCTTDAPILIIITAYVPRPPKWSSPTQRGKKS